MNLEIPDDVMRSIHMSPEDLRVEIAVFLFKEDKLTLGRAARLSGMPQPHFQRLLASRRIPLHYSVEDFRKDVKTLEKLGVR